MNKRGKRGIGENDKHEQGKGGLPEGLTQKQIKCLAYAYYDCLSNAEIGRRIGTTGENVGQIIKRGLEILKQSNISMERIRLTKPKIEYVDPFILDQRIVK